MKSILRDALIAVAVLCGLHAAAIAKPAAADTASSTLTYDSCSWNHPGVNPFMGDVVAAVDRYRDIPVDVRERLKARMAKREYDDLVSIRRDSIEGRGGYDYGSTISEMHFGTHQLCHSVTRSAWTPEMQERGLVYCEGGECILVPTVCRNVSRITRSGVGNESAAGLLPPPALATDAEPSFEKPLDWFGPTGAGMPPTDGAAPADGFAGPLGDRASGIGPLGGFAPPFVSSGPTSVAGGPGPQGLSSPPPVQAVPEPQTWLLMIGGLAALAGARRRRRVKP